jgi:hypothetical protein
MNPCLGLIVLLIEIPSLLWAMWSFQMHDHMPRSFIFHNENGIMNSDVCGLGKLGACVILFWTLLLCVTLFIIHQVYYKRLAQIHLFIVGMIFLLCFLMNYPLWIRTLPYFSLQLAVVGLLWA